MTILALEFSSPQRSVAILRGDHRAGFPPVSEVIETEPGNSGTFSLIDRALKVAGLEREQIECLVVGLGPGSYTGIRAAIAVAQGWQLARGIKLLGISSADCLAAQALSEGFAGRVNVVINAQRNEFYLAGYDLGDGTWRLFAPLRLATFSEVRQLALEGQTLVGPEVTRWFPSGREVFPRAGSLAKLAPGRTDFILGQKLEPIYLREAKFTKAAPPRALPIG